MKERKLLDQYNLQAKQNVTKVDISVAKTGYVALGVLGFQSGANECYFYSCVIVNNLLTYQIKNSADTNVSGTPNIDILYKKISA